MSTQPLALVEGLTRAWAGLYTAGASSDRRASRRGEIDSDLWEQRRAGSDSQRSAVATAGDVLGRLVRGVPADITWRLQTGGLHMQSKFMIECTTGALMVMIVLLAVVGMAGGPNIGSGEPYFSEGFLPLAQNLNDQARSVAFMFAAGAAMIAASLLLYSTFRGHGVRLAAAGAAALSVAGVGFRCERRRRRSPVCARWSVERRRSQGRCSLARRRYDGAIHRVLRHRRDTGSGR